MPDPTNHRLRAIATLLNIPVEAFSRPVEPYLLHGSENGDRWFLRRGPEGAPIVQHVGNPASGGYVTERSVLKFLERDHGSPQHQAMHALIERLLMVQLATY